MQRSPSRTRDLVVLTISVASLAVTLARAEQGSGQIEVIRGTQKQSISHRSGQTAAAMSESQESAPPELDIETVDIDIDTDRYTIDGNERAEIRREIRKLIGLYDEYLGIRVSPEFDVQLDVLGNRRTYQERQGTPQNTGGFYRQSTGETVVSGDTDRSFTRRTMLHESSHAILADGFPNAPRWLNEGMAEYFEGMELRGGRILIPRQEDRRRFVQGELRGGVRSQLERLLALESQAWNDQAETDFRFSYDQAWSIVYMLMETSRSRETLRQLLEAGSGSSIESIERIYPQGLGGFIRDWERWLSTNGLAHSYY